MMKQLFSLCFLLILAGCTESSFEGNHPISGNEEFYATFEDTNSRTYVDEQIRMRWNAEDEITIFKKNTYNRTFMFTGNTGANAGGFRQVSTDDDYWFGYDVDYSYAVYPHSAENALDETDLYLTVNMPAEQTYAENSFGLNANTMVAVSESNQLIFKNVGGYLRIRLYGENVAVSSVTLRSKGNEAIAGKAKITPSMEGNPTCEMTGTDKSIRLTCTEPVTISSDANAPTDFWIVVPPVTLAEGFTVTVENNMGNTQVYEVNQSFTFERNKYYDMTREVEIRNIKTVHVAEAGTLPSLISEEEKYQITEIKITGNLNGTDFKFIREMIGLTATCQITEGKLTYLDLSETYILEGGDAYLILSATDRISYTSNNQFPTDFLLGPSTNIQTIMIPHSAKSIGEYAFWNGTKLTSINIPDGVTSIGQSAFSGCSALTSINIPDGVTSIGQSAFSGCSALTSIYCYANTPPTIGYHSIGEGTTLYVPKGCKESYQSSEWNDYFTNITEMEE